jgi:hypothetical protein
MTEGLIEDGFTIRNSGRRDLWPAAGSPAPPTLGVGLEAIATETPPAAPAPAEVREPAPVTAAAPQPVRPPQAASAPAPAVPAAVPAAPAPAVPQAT